MMRIAGFRIRQGLSEAERDLGVGQVRRPSLVVGPFDVKRLIMTSASALIVFTTACGPVDPMESQYFYPESELLSEVWLRARSSGTGGKAVFQPATGANWRRLLKVDPCGPFYPGMSFAEAEEQFGEPDERGQNVHGAYIVYRRDGFRFLIGNYTSRTGSIPILLPEEDASHQRWILEAHPIESHVTDVFVPEVAEYIDGRREEFTIIGPDHPAVHGRLSGHKVVYLYPTPWAGCRGASPEEDPVVDR